jgi:hypothetical protein
VPRCNGEMVAAGRRKQQFIIWIDGQTVCQVETGLVNGNKRVGEERRKGEKKGGVVGKE